jgi:hypothetical protein
MLLTLEEAIHKMTSPAAQIGQTERGRVASRRGCNTRSGVTKQRVAALVIAGLAAITPVPAASQATGTDNDGRSAVVYPIDVSAAARPSLGALRISEPIRIDGVLDEPAWALADSATDFITALPRDGYPASERSVARVLYDGENLYVGAYLYDSRPERLFSPGLGQDFPTPDADLFGVALDTFLDRQNGIMFAINPAGAVFDAQMFNDSREINTAWEGMIETRVAVHADGWSVEIAIPLRTLRFRAAAGEQAWGVNFVRRVRRQNEDSYWAPIERHFRVHKMSRAGTLTGLSDLRQGRNLTLKPYVSAASLGGRARPDVAGHATDLDAGIDLKYGVTSRLTLDVTTFTDFSQVEVDQEQVNLTRFSLFFPEKRDFFLENDGIFTVGDVTERNYRTGSGPRDFKLFYSRSIGLSADRRPIPILGGARLSGRAGSTEIGVLGMQTRASDAGPAENFGVLRLRRNLGTTADIGMMVVNRQGTSSAARDEYNRAVGIDANLRLLRYLLVNSYLAATDEHDAAGDRASAYLQAAWRDRLWNVSAFVKHVGDGFNPETGFIRRRGVRQAFATFGAHPQPRIGRVAEINPYIDLSALENLDGVLETRWAKGGLAVSFLDGGTLSVEHENRFERLFSETNIAGALVPAGDYRFGETSLGYQASGARKLNGSAGVTIGDFYDGNRTSFNARLGVRPNVHFVVEAFAQHNDLRLGGDSFRADVFGGRIRYAASTRFFTSAFVQYIESTDELVTNLRLNYIHAPLSDIFLVLTERRGLDGAGLAERMLTLKATKLLAF